MFVYKYNINLVHFINHEEIKEKILLITNIILIINYKHTLNK